MQLRTARLCLDCEEVHENNECPVCASESYAFVTRWVPVTERRQRQRVAPPPVAVPEKSSTARWMRRGAAGLAVVAISRILWHTTRGREEN